MSGLNQSNFRVQEFVLFGFPGLQDKESKNILLAVFLAVYSLILLGNVLIIVILLLDEGLYIPMYLLILNLAILDIAISSITVPKLLTALMFNDNIISFAGCFIIMSVVKITTSEGRSKAFSTCGTHLLVICVFFLLAVFIILSYRIPGVSADARIMVSVLQSVIPSLANPIIYCLRSKEIRESFGKTLKKIQILPGGF
ncbi:olfactory receptor 1E5-like [Polypterus senegalus]|uniref:olfactory receptor 1E5-like n=1 Tax=Polypterus senegalus TaxID=55291 RepID=UPI0019634E84|nr:olfactory receptor 1E5-like [Polypterus senegalus]